MMFIMLFLTPLVKNFEGFLFHGLLRNITFAPAPVIPIVPKVLLRSYRDGAHTLSFLYDP
jgi:hypothetical protein